MIDTPSYYGIIPANVRYDKDLRPNAKLLYSELTCLATKEGYCFSSNNYFAELYDVDPSAVSKWIKQLADKGYIKVEYIYNGKECKERRIYINNNSIGIAENQEKVLPPVQEGYCQKTKDNNTSNNNINLNNINLPKPKKTNSKAELFDRIKQYTQNEELRTILTKYLKYKLSTSRGYSLEQWNLQLDLLLKNCGGDEKIAIDIVTNSYANGYQALCYPKQQNNKPEKKFTVINEKPHKELTDEELKEIPF